jgi:uncharacterized surface protein with fasciclin (FAS1) repeats
LAHEKSYPVTAAQLLRFRTGFLAPIHTLKSQRTVATSIHIEHSGKVFSFPFVEIRSAKHAPARPRLRRSLHLFPAKRRITESNAAECRPCINQNKQHMTKSIPSAVAALAVAFIVTAAYAAENPMVGGAPMLPKKNIIENASKSKEHTTLVAAVKAAGLVKTLEGNGPFTVFAPTNEAFEKLPAGTVDTLLKPENKEKLSGILTYHVLAGDYTAAKLMKAIKDADGSAKLQTVNGKSLTAKMSGDSIQLMDDQGNSAMVTIGDVMQSNGVIHVIDAVLMP